MRRLLLALAAAAALLAAGPVTIGPAAQVALAHSQLLSSTPGSGEIVATSPAELRLVFSEPLDPRFSTADVLNGAGQPVVDHAGSPDPTDATVLVVPLPLLANGAYTVNWRALSAADGHATSGFISFGVGSVDPSRVADDPGGQAGTLHGGHDLGSTLLEVQARTVADLGFPSRSACLSWRSGRSGRCSASGRRWPGRSHGAWSLPPSAGSRSAASRARHPALIPSAISSARDPGSSWWHAPR